MNPQSKPQLQITDTKLGEGAFSSVFLATRGTEKFAVKVYHAQPEKPELALQAAFREASLLARFDHPSLPKVHSVGNSKGNPTLVMELIEGVSLLSLIRNGKMTHSVKLQIAEALVEAIETIHSSGITHRDINPNNILVSASNHLTLLDFGLSVGTSSDRSNASVVGTAQYSSPEQLGMVARAIDCRSDLYSLGIVFYELFSGQLPFKSLDLGELLHQHAFQPAQDLHDLRPELDARLVKIIRQLMAKDPDDRYSSATKLRADLAQLGGQSLESSPRHARFFGRSGELGVMETTWREVLAGKTRSILIQGQPGIGKTRLVSEFLQPIENELSSVSPSPLVFQARCTLGNKTPFAPLLAPIESWLRFVDKSGVQHRAEVVKQIEAASRGMEVLLRELLLSIDVILSVKRESQPSRETYTQAQLAEALAEFLLRLTSDHAVLLILENSQWLDEASGQVLRAILNKPATFPVLLICLTRPATEKREEVFGLSHSVTISLDPFPQTVVDQLIAKTMGARPAPEKLAPYLFERSRGNPFMIEQYLELLLSTGICWPDWDQWQWKEEEAQKLRPPSDTVEFILNRITELEPGTRSTLTAAAVLGSPFSSDLLPSLTGKSNQEIQGDLTSAQRLHCIEGDQGGSFIFAHDAVQSYFLSQLSEKEQQTLHQRAFEALTADRSENREYWFELARHANSGNPSEHPKRAFDANFEAAKRATEVGATTEAWKYCKSAQVILEQQQSLISAHLEFHQFCGDLAAQIGELDESIAQYYKALALSQSPIIRAKLWSHLTSPQFESGPGDECLTSVRKALQEAKIPIPSSRSPYYELGLAKGLLGLELGKIAGKLGEEYSYKDSKKALDLIDIANNIRRTTFQKGQYRVGVLITFAVLKWAKKLPICRDLAFHYISSAISTSLIGLRQPTLEFLKREGQVVDALGDPTVTASNTLLRATCHFFMGSELEGSALARFAFSHYSKWTPPASSAIPASVAWTTSLVWRGKALEVLKVLDLIVDFFGKTYSSDIRSLSEPFSRVARISGNSLLGRAKELGESIAYCQDFFQGKEDWLIYYWTYLGNMAVFYLEQNELGPEVDLILEKHARTRNFTLGDWDARLIRVPKIHLRFRQWKNARSAERPSRLKLLDESLEELDRLVPTPLARGHALLIRTRRDHLLGKTGSILKALAQVERIGIETDSPWLLFEVHYGRAEFYRAQKNPGLALLMAKIALMIATEQQWKSFSKNVQEEFQIRPLIKGSGFESSDRPTLSSLGSLGSSTSSGESLWEQRRVSLLQRNLDAILRLNLESVHVFEPEKQVRTVLTEAIRLLGAERAILFIFNNELKGIEQKMGVHADGSPVEALGDHSAKTVSDAFSLLKPILYDALNPTDHEVSRSILIHDLRSILAVPLFLRSEPMGVLYCDSKIVKGAFSEEDVNLLSAIGTQIVIALEATRRVQLEIEKQLLQKDLESKKTLQLAYDALEKTTRDIRAILTHITQGICTIDGEMKIQGETSQFLRQITGKEKLDGLTLPNLLFFDSDLTRDQIETIRSAIAVSVGYESVNFEINASCLPHEFSRELENGQRQSLEIDWLPLTDSNDCVQNIMCTLRDVTVLKTLRQQSLKNQRELQMLQELLRLKPGQFGFFSDSETMLIKSEALLSSMGETSLQRPLTQEQIAPLFRTLHTIKGNARMHRLQLIAESAHEVESSLPVADPTLLLDSHRKLRGLLKEHSQLLQDKLSQFNLLLKQDSNPKETDALTVLSFSNFLDPIRTSAAEIATSLGKVAPRISVSGDEIWVSKKRVTLLLGAFNHLVRNSIDHGFTQEQRSPEIQISCKFGDPVSSFVYSDNGQGLNLAKVEAKGLEKELLSVGATPDEIANLIFAPGFSSREEVTELSGRGVGMDAFKEAMRELGGDAVVKLGEEKKGRRHRSFEIRFTMKSGALRWVS